MNVKYYFRYVNIIHHIWCNVNTLDVVYDIFLKGDNVKTYVERIRELREDNDLKQEFVAELLKTTQQVYSRYEKGVNEMPLRHLITLARFYKVSVDYLVGETNCKTRYPEK